MYIDREFLKINLYQNVANICIKLQLQLLTKGMIHHYKWPSLNWKNFQENTAHRKEIDYNELLDSIFFFWS